MSGHEAGGHAIGKGYCMAKRERTSGRPPVLKQIRSSSERQQEIAMRAYELYAAHGYRQGHDLDDWLEAEREIDRAAYSLPLFRLYRISIS